MRYTIRPRRAWPKDIMWRASRSDSTGPSITGKLTAATSETVIRLTCVTNLAPTGEAFMHTATSKHVLSPRGDGGRTGPHEAAFVLESLTRQVVPIKWPMLCQIKSKVSLNILAVQETWLKGEFSQGYIWD